MYNSIVIRNGEVAIKGANRPIFEKKLIKNLKRALYGIEGYHVYKADGRTYIDFEENIQSEILNRIKNVFGVVSYSPVIKTEPGYEPAKKTALELYDYFVENNNCKTFRVSVKRQDKTLPMKSPDMARDIAGFLLSSGKKPLEVDMSHPELHIHVELRKSGNVVYAEKFDGVGGMPVGVGGKAMVLLSGGIDSPVASYLIAKRGLQIKAVHFHSFPFTSERSKEKIEQLAKQLSLYTEGIRIHMVNLLPIQTKIAEKCPEELMTILSRRFMMRIAEKIALDRNCGGLVTGESIGQVASQTVEGLQSTNAVVKTIPVFRPLISFDKEDIIEVAKKIGTFDISIIPEEDCCTVFLPKHPVTKPKLSKVEKAEEVLDVEDMLNEAISLVEVREVGMLQW